MKDTVPKIYEDSHPWFEAQKAMVEGNNVDLQIMSLGTSGKLRREMIKNATLPCNGQNREWSLERLGFYATIKGRFFFIVEELLVR